MIKYLLNTKVIWSFNDGMTHFSILTWKVEISFLNKIILTSLSQKKKKIILTSRFRSWIPSILNQPHSVMWWPCLIPDAATSTL
jgi:hypothetical protein